MSDDDLVALLKDLVLGAVRARGYDVTRDQCRRCIRQIDPLTIPLRWQGNLRSRRPYSVPGPNSLRHLGKFHSSHNYCAIIIILLCLHEQASEVYGSVLCVCLSVCLSV